MASTTSSRRRSAAWIRSSTSASPEDTSRENRPFWNEVVPFYAFPAEVRRLLYTTNAIEALNSTLRRAVRARGHFPTEEAAPKLVRP